MTFLVALAVVVFVILVIAYIPLTVFASVISLGLIYASQMPGSSATPDGVGAAVLVLMSAALFFDSSWRKKRVAKEEHRRLLKRAREEIALEAVKDKLRTQHS